MDYFFNNPEAFAPQGGYYDNVQELDSASSSSPQNNPKLFEYANTNTALFQGTDQSWAPLELDNLVDFAEDELQVLEPGSTANSSDGQNGNPQTTKMRRRAQNRASQRAFRERKDRHLKGLEYQLENLNEKHQDLMQSYMKQSESVAKLHSRLAELRVQVKSMKTHQRSVQSAAPSEKNNKSRQTVDSFDAFSFTSREDFPLDERENSFWRDIAQPNTGSPTDENGLPAFEDLLNLN